MKKLSLVVPVYYEQEVILQFLKETKEELDKLPIVYEYIFDLRPTNSVIEIPLVSSLNLPTTFLLETSYNGCSSV